ncbi:hypothetical protein JYG30_06270 [Fibrella sp. USSR17]
MKEYTYQAFKLEVTSLKKKFRAGVNKLYPNANDRDFANGKRNNVIIHGSMIYTFDNNWHIADIFDKGYRLGSPSLYELLLSINELVMGKVSAEQVSEVKPIGEDLNTFLVTFPSIKVIPGRSTILERLKEENSVEVTFNYFAEMYALQGLVSDITESLDSKKPPLGDLKQIEWLGSQKQLGDLFVTLVDKGWIAEIPAYQTIKAAFTQSSSIEQILKPSRDKKLGIAEYEQIYTSSYRSPFDKIKIKY